MRRSLIIFALAAWLGVGLMPTSPSYAQAPAEIGGALSRLKNNPRYRGRILGTHVKRDGRRFLYEVRILRPDDRVILVYIDPETGGVVGDSERRRSAAPDRGGRQDRARGSRDDAPERKNRRRQR